MCPVDNVSALGERLKECFIRTCTIKTRWLGLGFGSNVPSQTFMRPVMILKSMQETEVEELAEGGGAATSVLKSSVGVCVVLCVVACCSGSTLLVSEHRDTCSVWTDSEDVLISAKQT